MRTVSWRRFKLANKHRRPYRLSDHGCAFTATWTEARHWFNQGGRIIF